MLWLSYKGKKVGNKVVTLHSDTLKVNLWQGAAGI